MTDRGASIRDHLRAVAKARGVNTEFILTRWVVERYLHRLSLSPHRDRLVLKGGYLFAAWEGDLHRSTTDLDLQASEIRDPEWMRDVLAAVALHPVDAPDGVAFQPEDLRSCVLTSGRVPGVRVTIPAYVGGARIFLKVDVGFGSPVTPGSEKRWYPSLLPGTGATLLSCCPRETVIAEKLAVGVEFGKDNTRLRDYYDLWYLSARYRFLGHVLLEAIEATFATRDAGVFLARRDGYWEAAYSRGFASARIERSWREWLAEHAPGTDCPSLGDTTEAVGRFALPVLTALRDHRPLVARWAPSAGWLPESSRPVLHSWATAQNAPGE